jgi:hypothetical protein
MDAQRDRETRQNKALDEALERARAAFSGKSDEQILDEVTEVIDRVRAARRIEAASPTSA